MRGPSLKRGLLRSATLLMLAALAGCQPAAPKQAISASPPPAKHGRPSAGHMPVPVDPTLTISAVALSADGTRALTGYTMERYHGDEAHSRLLTLWDTTTGKEIWTAKGLGGIRAIAFCPDGKHALTAGIRDGQALREWNLAKGECVRTVGHLSSGFVCLAVSPSGQWILTGSLQGPLQIWDSATGKLHQTFGPKIAMAKSVTFSPDSTLALASLNPGFDPETPWLVLWDLAGNRLAHAFKGSTRLGNGPTAFSLEGNRAASLKWKDKLRGQNYLVVWKVPNGCSVRSLKVECPQAVAFGSDGRSLVAADFSSPGKGPPNLARWDLASGRQLWSRGLGKGWAALTISTDGRLALFARGGAIYGWNGGPRPELLLWDAEHGKQLRKWQAPYWTNGPQPLPITERSHPPRSGRAPLLAKADAGRAVATSFDIPATVGVHASLDR